MYLALLAGWGRSRTSPVAKVGQGPEDHRAGDEDITLTDHDQVCLLDVRLLVGKVPQPQGLRDVSVLVPPAPGRYSHTGAQAPQAPA